MVQLIPTKISAITFGFCLPTEERGENSGKREEVLHKKEARGGDWAEGLLEYHFMKPSMLYMSPPKLLLHAS